MTSLNITGYHSHVYFEADTLSQARGLIQAAGKDLPVVVGRIHEKPVGPHTRWSCQLAYEPGSFEQVMSWLAVHRNGLTVFTHPLTGDPVAEHQDFAIRMGSIEPLNIEILEELVTTQNSASWLYRSRTSLDNLAIELSEESNKIQCVVNSPCIRADSDFSIPLGFQYVLGCFYQVLAHELAA